MRDTVRGLPPEKAEIRLAMTGDDLEALVDGELQFARAWGSGRVKLEAGLRDLLGDIEGLRALGRRAEAFVRGERDVPGAARILSRELGALLAAGPDDAS